MTTQAIIDLIMSMAPIFGIEPKVALAVAAIESSFNPNAVGGAGEIGLFQIMPDLGQKRGFTRRQLKDPAVNVFVGLSMLAEAKDNCPHKRGITYLICYNYGARNAKKVKHPTLFPYVKRAQAAMKTNLISSQVKK